MSKLRFFALKELSNRKPLQITPPSSKLSEYYASHVSNKKKMQEYLPREAFNEFTKALDKSTPITRELADLIANGMNSWAKTLHVTHYTHWFQPLTDGTAEKHDGFIELNDGTFFKNLQVVFENDLDNFEEISHYAIATAISVRGTLVLTPDSKQPFEL